MNERQARQIRFGIHAAWCDMTGRWQRPPIRHRLERLAYNRTISQHATPGERYKLAEMRILAAKMRG